MIKLLTVLSALTLVFISTVYANNLRDGDWIYTEWGTDKTLFDYRIKSENVVDLAYGHDDYNGRDKAEFKLEEKPGKRRAASLSLGRAVIKNDFLCFSQCFISISFDDKNYGQYLAINEYRHTAVRISGHTLIGVGEESILTIQSNGELERKIAEAEKMTIRVDFYQGNYTSEAHEYVFNVSGLDFESKANNYYQKSR